MYLALSFKCFSYTILKSNYKIPNVPYLELKCLNGIVISSSAETSHHSTKSKAYLSVSSLYTDSRYVHCAKERLITFLYMSEFSNSEKIVVRSSFSSVCSTKENFINMHKNTTSMDTSIPVIVSVRVQQALGK